MVRGKDVNFPQTFLAISPRVRRTSCHGCVTPPSSSSDNFQAHARREAPTSAAMDLKSMILEAKSREMGLYEKFQEYDADGSGAIDEVRMDGRVALWNVHQDVREVHLGGGERAYARA